MPGVTVDEWCRTAARDSVARCPRWWSGAEHRSERIDQCVSEERRSRAARWGAWAPKIRRLSASLISRTRVPDRDGTRAANIVRASSETQLDCDVRLEGGGEIEVETGLPFLDHML